MAGLLHRLHSLSLSLSFFFSRTRVSCFLLVAVFAVLVTCYFESKKRGGGKSKHKKRVSFFDLNPCLVAERVETLTLSQHLKQDRPASHQSLSSFSTASLVFKRLYCFSRFQEALLFLSFSRGWDIGRCFSKLITLEAV